MLTGSLRSQPAQAGDENEVDIASLEETSAELEALVQAQEPRPPHPYDILNGNLNDVDRN